MTMKTTFAALALAGASMVALAAPAGAALMLEISGTATAYQNVWRDGQVVISRSGLDAIFYVLYDPNEFNLHDLAIRNSDFGQVRIFWTGDSWRLESWGTQHPISPTLDLDLASGTGSLAYIEGDSRSGNDTLTQGTVTSVQMRWIDTDATPRFVTLGYAVPEPATWAMMIAGFGLAGAALRSRRRVSVAHA